MGRYLPSYFICLLCGLSEYVSRWYVVSSLSLPLPLSHFLAAIIIMPLHSTLSERDIINFHPSRVYLKEKRSWREATYLGTYICEQWISSHRKHAYMYPETGRMRSDCGKR